MIVKILCGNVCDLPNPEPGTMRRSDCLYYILSVTHRDTQDKLALTDKEFTVSNENLGSRSDFPWLHLGLKHCHRGFMSLRHLLPTMVYQLNIGRWGGCGCGSGVFSHSSGSKDCSRKILIGPAWSCAHPRANPCGQAWVTRLPLWPGSP